MPGARPMPQPTPLSRPFWEATARGELALQRCTRCAGYEWTPQMACSRCLAETLAWVPVSGKGTVYSWTVVRRPPSPAFDAPYVLAIVELVEGPRLLTNLVGIPEALLAIGMPVRVVFERAGDLALYPFTADVAP